MDSSRRRAFIEIGFIEIIRPRNVHVVEACYLQEFISTEIGMSDLSPTPLHCGDLGNAVEA